MKKIFSWCKRYLSLMTILVVAFVAYMLFMQENSVLKYLEYSRTIDSLKVEIDKANDTTYYYHQLNQRLSSDPEEMEKVVREQYNMNRDGEDVYVFE